MNSLKKPSQRLPLLNIVVALVFLTLLPLSRASDNTPCQSSTTTAASNADLRAGDIVFIHVGGPLFSRIAATSKGWVSHVGIIVGQQQGVWMVAESAVPCSRKTSLDSFLKRSTTGQFAIKRLKSGLTAPQIETLHSAVDHRMNKVYDFGFNLDSKRSSFCSKFVYQVVQESTGQSLR